MGSFQASSAIVRILRHSQRPASFTAAGAISLSMGEPDFPTPEPIVRAAADALAGGWTRYGDFDGDPELRGAIARRVEGVRHLPCGDDEVVVTHGATAGIAAAIVAVVDPGNRVVIPEPTYSLYPDLVRLAGGTPVPVPMRADHHLDFEALKQALPGARLVVLCNPCNPTGAVFSRAELQQLSRLLAGTDTLLLVDEAYDHFVYGVEFVSCLRIPALNERLIHVQTFSKTYAMTGWRIGYVVARHDVARAITRAHRTFNGPVNAAVQRAALRALGDDGTLVKPMLDVYTRRRDLMMDLLRQIPSLACRAPEGAFYVFGKYGNGLPASELVRRLGEAGVMVRAGSEFGASGEGHIRISFAASEPDIAEGLRRLRAVMDRLQHEPTTRARPPSLAYSS
jgi:aspartate aminotransferase